MNKKFLFVNQPLTRFTTKFFAKYFANFFVAKNRNFYMHCKFEKYSRIRKDIFSNNNQPFVQNACKNFNFPQKEKFVKYF